MPKKKIKDPASFKDPSGHIFIRKGEVFRQINPVYFPDFRALTESGLYSRLVREKLLVPHKQITQSAGKIIIKPRKIPFISYPYEWSFSQLKDAAMLTLQIQKIALNKGMILKDASAYNIQFLEGRAVLIDTLSFEKYKAGQGWIAYRQFCMHFLAPLLLMSMLDVRFNKLLQVYPEGIPLDLANSLLGLKSLFNMGALIHIKAHSKAENQFSDIDLESRPYEMKLSELEGLTDSLESTVRRLKIKKQKTEWAGYYQRTNYSAKAFQDKKEIIKSIIGKIKPKQIWDLGANEGTFSRLADKSSYVVSFDIDPLSVEENYLFNREHKIKNCLPLLLDLSNPSPAIGWANQERLSFAERGPVDLIMALALIHHLVISYNLNFGMIAEYFCRLGPNLIIEFVPKEDSQVQKLLRNRRDIFTDYNQSVFEKEFSKKFKILSCRRIKDSLRSVYLMRASV